MGMPIRLISVAEQAYLSLTCYQIFNNRSFVFSCAGYCHIIGANNRIRNILHYVIFSDLARMELTWTQPTREYTTRK